MSEAKAYFYNPTACIRAYGEDVTAFLQGQFSNDLLLGDCVYGYWLDRKGKILADSFVLKRNDEDYLIISYNCPSEAIIERLDAYIVMDDVELEELSTELAAVSLWGNGIKTMSEKLNIELPKEGGCTYMGDVVAFWGLRDRVPVLEIVGLDKGALAGMQSAIECEVLDQDQLDLISVRAMRPVPNRSIGKSDLPQETGLAKLSVSYTKGCYLGQEVMARIQSMGRVRRQLRSVLISSNEKLELPGLIVDEAGAKSGELRSQIVVGVESAGFAMIRVGAEAKNLWVDSAGTLLEVRVEEGEING